MATVTKFVGTDAFSTTTFNNKIDEINVALLSAGKSAFATIGTSVNETTLVYTSDDCDYYCGANPEENANIIQRAMNENDCICFLSGVYNISKPIIVEGKTIIGNENASIQQHETNWTGDFLFKTSDYSSKRNYVGNLQFAITSSSVGAISFFGSAEIENCYFTGGKYGVCGDQPVRVNNCFFSEVTNCVSGRTDLVITNNVAKSFNIFVMDSIQQKGQNGNATIQGNIAESSVEGSCIVSPSANGGNMNYVLIFGNRLRATNFITVAGGKTTFNYTIVGNDMSFDSNQNLLTKKTIVVGNNINTSLSVTSDSLSANNL